MSNNKFAFGLIYYSHVKLNNYHAFIATGAYVILLNMDIPLDLIDIYRNYIQKVVYISQQINFHKRGHFGDMLLQLIHLKIYINIPKFEFKIA